MTTTSGTLFILLYWVFRFTLLVIYISREGSWKCAGLLVFNVLLSQYWSDRILEFYIITFLIGSNFITCVGLSNFLYLIKLYDLEQNIEPVYFLRHLLNSPPSIVRNTELKQRFLLFVYYFYFHIHMI